MSEDILSEEERDALRAEVQRNSGSADNLHLGSGDQAARRLLPTLERRFTALCERARAVFGKELGNLPDIGESTMNLVTTTLSDIVAELVPPTEVALPEFGMLAYIGFNDVLATQLVEAAYGAERDADAEVSVAPPRTKITEVERQTLLSTLDVLSAALGDIVFAAKGKPLTLKMLPMPAESVKLTSAKPAVVLCHSFKVYNQEARLTIVLLPSAVDLLNTAETSSVTSPASMMAHHVEQTEVLVMALLGTTHLPLNDIASLQPGNMIWLDRTKSDHVAVLVEGETKFLADPVQRGGVIGIEILSRLT
jgi:flagellar motor switch protein FliM